MFFVLFETRFLYLGTHCGVQDSLKPTATLPPWPPQHQDYRYDPPCSLQQRSLSVSNTGIHYSAWHSAGAADSLVDVIKYCGKSNLGKKGSRGRQFQITVHYCRGVKEGASSCTTTVKNREHKFRALVCLHLAAPLYHHSPGPHTWERNGASHSRWRLPRPTNLPKKCL